MAQRQLRSDGSETGHVRLLSLAARDGGANLLDYGRAAGPVVCVVGRHWTSEGFEPSGSAASTIPLHLGGHVAVVPEAAAVADEDEILVMRKDRLPLPFSDGTASGSADMSIEVPVGFGTLLGPLPPGELTLLVKRWTGAESELVVTVKAGVVDLVRVARP
jgi:hypothetical protein